jgi:hypothetical protein
MIPHSETTDRKPATKQARKSDMANFVWNGFGAKFGGTTDLGLATNWPPPCRLSLDTTPVTHVN